MVHSQKADRVAVSKDRSERLSSLGSAVDAYALRGTLDGYEVDELDGHDLARFLPTIVLSEQSQQELEPTNPDRD